MKLATTTMQRLSIEAMQNKYEKIANLQTQISSGQRIQKLSDDPAGAARINELTREIARYEQFSSNMDYAETRLEFEETNLQSIGDVLQSVREEAVRAVNGTLNTQDRAAVAKQFELAAEQLVGLMNAKGSDGEYIFSGYNSSVTPFSLTEIAPATTPPTWQGAYSGDNNQRAVRIADGVTMPLGHAGQLSNGDALFGTGTAPGTNGGENIAALIMNFAEELKADNLASGGSILSQIDTVMERVTNAQAEAGARMNMISSQREVNLDYSLYLEQKKADVHDVDITEAITSLTQEMTSMQALQQTYTRVNQLSLFNYL
ncbi:flagellar hook-associated protein 3 [Ectothiorhodospiraceae bacterium BW-2]|nr:flagellar hook-associated protein 3 [Ectothiorhodospiraceae bacterium BW-2]